MIPLDEIEFEEKEHAVGTARADIFRALLLLAPAMLMSTTGQAFLKFGMNQIGAFDFTARAILTILPQVITSPFIWLGGVGFLGGTVFWLAVLSRVPLSVAYPVLALSYLIVTVEAWLFLGEPFSWMRLAGVLVIVVGVVVVGLSENSQKRS